MPRSVTIPCNSPAKAVHFLSGVGGWNYPATPKGSVSLIVRLRYADGDVSASFKDIAILYRFHALGESLQKYLLEAGIPCQLAREAMGPEISGIELALQLRRNNPQLPVLLISGHNTDAVNLLLQNTPLSHAYFLPKPFTRTALVRKLGEALGNTVPAF